VANSYLKYLIQTEKKIFIFFLGGHSSILEVEGAAVFGASLSRFFLTCYAAFAPVRDAALSL
jgi:hypothetical protein